MKTNIIKLAFFVIAGIFLIIFLFDLILMGSFSLRIDSTCHQKEYLITKENRIDYQRKLDCAGYSSAYVLRHFGIEAYGKHIYDSMPKMKNGCVYPKHLKNTLKQNGLNVKYAAGNLKALKNEIAKGNPVIVFIRLKEKSSELHFVPVVGYDKENLYLAESVSYLINSGSDFYNRKISNKEFIRVSILIITINPIFVC